MNPEPTRVSFVRVTPRRTALRGLAAFAAVAFFSARAVAQRSPRLDVVLVGGRVLDPETRLDAVAVDPTGVMPTPRFSSGWD